MSERITEKDLILPALYAIDISKGANTTDLIRILTEVFNPTDEDAMILAGRKDTKFSQKVRNLKSHSKSNGFDKMIIKDSAGKMVLSKEGQQLVDENRETLEYLFKGRFDFNDAAELFAKIEKCRNNKKKVITYNEDDMISEGLSFSKMTKVKKRSKKLRDAAIEHYTDKRGHIKCAVCGFDFQKVYGELGKGYIQIHHEKPICQYSDDGFEKYIAEAIKDMKPVCANCHCMIHRNKKETLTIKALKEIINN